jgi:uncharacterized Zn-binding protein involved in type VI secretion
MPTKPATRTVDTTDHGGALGAGAPNVAANGRPTIRLSDSHICPATQPVAHVGGVVQLGSGGALSVLINRKPAIAMGGQASCAMEDPNPINGASENVFYGVTDTIAGLKVTQDPDGTIHIGDHITIRSVQTRDIHANGVTTTITDDDYAAHVLADITKIGSTDIGAARLQSLEGSGRDTTIVPNSGNSKNAYASPLDSVDASNGKGSDVHLEYTPEEWPPDPRAETTTSGVEGDVILYHEMTHGDHQARGKMESTAKDPKAGAYDTPEEKATIEDGGENIYRKARGFRERHDHHHN